MAFSTPDTSTQGRNIYIYLAWLSTSLRNERTVPETETPAQSGRAFNPT